MDKIKNSLFLNYERQNGKQIVLKAKGYSIKRPSGTVHAIAEYLVPSTSDATHNTLVSIANSLFIEARTHNMSLSPFGHSDPIKFVIAAAYLPLMMKEIKRDIAIAAKYQFANVNFGYPLAAAAGFDLNDAITNIANYCKDYNIVAAKVNALYVPVSGLVQRWMDHRAHVFKDDEGDRYSMYLYVMQNYYELDTDPNSLTVGQLLFKPWIKNKNITIGSLLQLVSSLADKYAADDDFSSFCTEAIQAKMSRLVIDPIKANADVWELPVLDMIFSLDDVLSLENACFNIPVYLEGFTAGSGKCDWNITEDPLTGILTCGHIGQESGLLPVYYHGIQDLDTNYPSLVHAYNLCEQISISDRYLFTHAKIKSLEGLTQLTRYVNSYGKEKGISAFGSIAKANAILGKEVKSQNVPTQFSVFPLNGYSTEILGTITCYHMAGSTVIENVLKSRMGFVGSNSENSDNYFIDKMLMIGFKARIFTYMYDSGLDELVLDGGDFDYITTVTKDTLDTFFGVNAWNDIQLIGSISDSQSSDNNNN